MDADDDVLEGRRRVVLGLGVMLLAACGGGGSNKNAASSASSSSSSPSSGTATTATTAPASSSSSIPPDQVIPDDVILDDATSYNGVWNATWTHNDGTSGPAQGTLTIDPATRSFDVTISLGEGFYGAGSSAISETQHFALDDYAWDQTEYQGITKLFGRGTLQRPDIGSGRIEINGVQIPNHPEVESINVTAARLNFIEPHPFAYTIKRTDGTTITGNLTFDKA